MKIVDAFDGGRPVFSFEFFPPKTPEAVDQLYRVIAEELRPLRPTFVSVTYGAGGSTRELTVDLVSNIKRELGIEAMAHLTCVGQTAAEISQVLDRLRAGGIDNVLTLRGDPPRGETTFVKPEGGFGFGQELARFVRAHYDFCLGGGCYPEVHPEAPDAETDLRHLKEKVDSGVQFLITQLFFAPAVYFDFVARARAAGITVPIVPGIMPVTNLAQIERFTSLCGASIPAVLRSRLQACPEPDVPAVGVDWAREQCKTLLDGGAPGIHFYTLNRSPSTRAILRNLGLAEQAQR